MAEMAQGRSQLHRVTATNRVWLSEDTFELKVSRPEKFTFKAGQKVMLQKQECSREYTLACAAEGDLVFCIKKVPQGEMSSLLAAVKPGDVLDMSGAYGFFIHRPGNSVFVATGTGVAPFAAYALSGVSDFILLHGVKNRGNLYYQNILRKAAARYIPCLSSPFSDEAADPEAFHGRVTNYLSSQLPMGKYDFYLCGNGDMIQETIRLIDHKFTGSRIFTEIYYR